MMAESRQAGDILALKCNEAQQPLCCATRAVELAQLSLSSTIASFCALCHAHEVACVWLTAHPMCAVVFPHVGHFGLKWGTYQHQLAESLHELGIWDWLKVLPPKLC